VGRELPTLRPVADKPPCKALLAVKDLCLRHPVRPQDNLLDRISFAVGRGEIVGIFGLMGAGRTELLETLFGLHAARASGQIWLEGQETRFREPIDAIRAGLALVPEDRKRDGLVLGLDVQTNISLANLERVEQTGLLHQGKETSLARQYIADLRIKTFSEKQEVRSLSGGNQQKIVLSKWLATSPRLLLLDEPTRGIDINAKTEIYKLMLELAASGMGILMASSELPEILAVSDRVLVLSEGRLTAELPSSKATEEAILKAAIPTSI
jgi:ribose transport system ATP-binding protein